MGKTGIVLCLVIYFNLSWAQKPYKTQIKETDSLYKAACSWAMANVPDSAFQKLDVITGKSYFVYDQLLTDTSFKSIHADKRWLPLLDQIKKVKLTAFPAAQLEHDFDLFISALKEAHTGLYWYNTRPQFDSLCQEQRAKIKPGMNELDFYNIAAPVAAFIKEGHTALTIGAKAQAYMKFSGRYFPVFLKFSNNKAYIINDPGNIKIKGFELTKVNGHPIEEIMQKFMSYEPSDGYNTTGKYRWIEQNGKFSTYYARAYPFTESYTIEVADPATGKKRTFNQIAAADYDDFRKSYKMISDKIGGINYTLPAEIKLDSIAHTAILTFNSFSQKRYKSAGMNFQKFVDESFQVIKDQKIQHLVIDIRKNGGGREGYEDYLLAYLINKDYLKYTYVQASAFSYSFYKYTEYSDSYEELENELKEEHYLEKDGRILRKPAVLAHEKPKPDPFKGDIYVLTSGLTYSGGAEFASLARNHTNAVFIGEETSGGYYGNTSGITILLQLPASKIQIEIPILKFVVNTPKDNVPFGHGTLPDYSIQSNISQFLNGHDAEMEMAKKLIRQTIPE